MRSHGTAPGRVCVIGEHIDYNGGTALLAALSLGLEVDLDPRGDDQIAIHADHYEEAAHRTLEDAANGHWSDMCVGALREARALGYLAHGADLHVRSTLPEGSGLSSSAALVVAILKAARAHAGGSERDTDLAVAARRVENDYIGVPCGIMDQMAVAVATPGTAMALDTRALTHELLALPASHDVVVIHSGVTRKLTDGRYAERKVECDAAKAHFGTQDLCLLEPNAIAASDLAEPYRKRALHCATEHRRVLAAVAALKAGDMAQMGALMAQSHISMRDDFEMSVPPIDALVADALDLGATGARLTGGGFGGCIVALVEKSMRVSWQERLLAAHGKARFIAAF